MPRRRGQDLGCGDQLEPSDRLVFYTDGIAEARRAGNEEFGLARLTDFLIHHHAAGLPVPETLRRLIHAVLEHDDGHLQDGATVLFGEWLGPVPQPTGRAAALAGLPPTDPAASRRPRMELPVS